MDSLLETIRAAVATDATADARVAGASACRTILTALEADLGQPMPASSSVPTTPIAAAVTALRGLPAEQLLDLAIARLRAALPADAVVPAVQPMKFHLIPVSQQLASRGRP